MSDKRKHKKSLRRKEKKSLEQTNNAFFQISGRGSLLNLTKAHIITTQNGSIKMNMEKNYHKYYNYHLYLVPTDESTCSSESKAEPHNESLPHEMFFAKEKKTFWYL